MKNRLFIILAAAVMVMACGGRTYDVEVIPIQDNAYPRLMARALFPEAPDSLFESLGLQDGIPSSVCAFLVRTEGKNILFDAANGAPDSRLMSVLDSCGVAPAAVDYIFITHMHGDHIGGLMKDGVASFPNADLFINKVEYDAWMANPQVSLLAMAKAYEGRLRTFGIADHLPCGVEAVEAYGHTAGHTAYKVGNNLIVGDIMHGVALQLEYPQYCARFDADHEQSVNTRKEILKMGRDNGLILYGMHFPAPYFITNPCATFKR